VELVTTDLTLLPAWTSYSQINTYTRCGEQYRLEKLLHAPAAPAWALLGGSATHTGTEEWDHAYLQGEILEDYAALWEKHFAVQIAETEAKSDVPKGEWRASGRKSAKWPDKETEEWWNENGPVFLASWASWRLNGPWEIWTTAEGVPGIEIGVNVDVGECLGCGGEHPVKGSIDRLMYNPADPDSVVVVDIKSGAEPDDHLQLGTYAKGVRDLMGVDPTYGTYWLARTGSTTLLHPMAKYSDEYLAYEYGNARKGMEAGIFLPKVTRMCNGCSQRQNCFAYGGENSAEYSPLSS
jgi:hypothetical protein